MGRAHRSAFLPQRCNLTQQYKSQMIDTNSYPSYCLQEAWPCDFPVGKVRHFLAMVIDDWHPQHINLPLTLNGIFNFRANFSRHSQGNFSPLGRLTLKDLSYEGLRIYMDMTTHYDILKEVARPLMFKKNWGLLERLSEELSPKEWKLFSYHDILRPMISFAPYDFLLRMLPKIHGYNPQALGKFSDASGNNLLVHFLFHTMFQNHGPAAQVVEMLKEFGVNPNQNYFGVSYQSLRNAIDGFFDHCRAEQKKLTQNLYNARRRRDFATCRNCKSLRFIPLTGTYYCANVRPHLRDPWCTESPDEPVTQENFEKVHINLLDKSQCPVVSA